MKLSKQFTPLNLRILFDLLVTFGSAFYTYFFISTFAQPSSLSIFLLPILNLVFLYVFGLYTYRKISSGEKKVLFVLLSCALTIVIGVFFHFDLASLLLFATLAFAGMAIPRYFLNIGFKQTRTFNRNAIQEKNPVLVVGGAGYIGTYVVEELLKANKRVRILDKLLYGKNSLKDFLDDPRVEFIEGDSTDISKLALAMTDVSAVVHLAGLVGDPACALDRNFTRHTNVISTRMVKEIAKSLGIRRFIFASSCSVYGASDEKVEENSSMNPVSLYAITKIDSEKELLASMTDDFQPIILRFATVFGHSRRPRFDLVVNFFTAQAMTSGVITVTGADQWRPFIHCHDIARAIVMTLQAPLDKVAGQIFNVGDDSLNMTIGQLGEKVAEVAKKAGIQYVEVSQKNEAADRRNYKVSFDKIRQVLGFQASITIEQGILRMVEGFKKGEYGDYKNPRYSNLETTKEAVIDFNDPLQLSRLYQPMAEPTLLEDAK